jgi:hypothetical protein
LDKEVRVECTDVEVTVLGRETLLDEFMGVIVAINVGE